jgi:hypothetical protein
MARFSHKGILGFTCPYFRERLWLQQDRFVPGRVNEAPRKLGVAALAGTFKRASALKASPKNALNERRGGQPCQDIEPTVWPL